MFQLVIVEDKLKIVPEQFGRDPTKVLLELIGTSLSLSSLLSSSFLLTELKFLNKILLDGGLCISFFDFVSADDPYVYPAEGAAHQLVNFRLVVFRPFINEVLVGRIVTSSKEGLKVSLEFFDDILIPHTFLQAPCEFIEKTNTWNWLFSDDDENTVVQSLPYEINEIIRFRVRAVNINAPTSAAKVNNNTDTNAGAARNRSLSIGNGEDMILPAMQVIGSVQGDGFGMCSWWQ